MRDSSLPLSRSAGCTIRAHNRRNTLNPGVDGRIVHYPYPPLLNWNASPESVKAMTNDKPCMAPPRKPSQEMFERADEMKKAAAEKRKAPKALKQAPACIFRKAT
jgi:hypothetical protein